MKVGFRCVCVAANRLERLATRAAELPSAAQAHGCFESLPKHAHGVVGWNDSTGGSLHTVTH
jgi:hypothetical protein